MDWNPSASKPGTSSGTAVALALSSAFALTSTTSKTSRRMETYGESLMRPILRGWRQPQQFRGVGVEQALLLLAGEPEPAHVLAGMLGRVHRVVRAEQRPVHADLPHCLGLGLQRVW